MSTLPPARGPRLALASTLVGCFLLAAAVRLPGRGARSLGAAEQTAFVESQGHSTRAVVPIDRSLSADALTRRSGLLEVGRGASGPPLHAVGLALWTRAAGTSETALRVPSELAGALAAALAALVAGQIAGPWAAALGRRPRRSLADPHAGQPRRRARGPPRPSSSRLPGPCPAGGIVGRPRRRGAPATPVAAAATRAASDGSCRGEHRRGRRRRRRAPRPRPLSARLRRDPDLDPRGHGFGNPALHRRFLHPRGRARVPPRRVSRAVRDPADRALRGPHGLGRGAASGASPRVPRRGRPRPVRARRHAGARHGPRHAAAGHTAPRRAAVRRRPDGRRPRVAARPSRVGRRRGRLWRAGLVPDPGSRPAGLRDLADPGPRTGGRALPLGRHRGRRPAAARPAGARGLGRAGPVRPAGGEGPECPRAP